MLHSEMSPTVPSLLVHLRISAASTGGVMLLGKRMLVPVRLNPRSWWRWQCSRTPHRAHMMLLLG